MTFTLCVEAKKPLFVQQPVVDKVLEILKESKNKFNCKNWVYVFMPEHMHLILEGETEQSDLWKAIILFKQKTGFWLAQNKMYGWQKDFYDHIHRKEDDLKQHISYILDNPVRKGFVPGWEDYSFSGSLDFNLHEIIS